MGSIPSRFLDRWPIATVLAAAMVTTVLSLLDNAFISSPSSFTTLGDKPARLALFVFVGSLGWWSVVSALARVAGRFVTFLLSFSGLWVLVHLGQLPLAEFWEPLERLLLNGLVFGLILAVVSELAVRLWPGSLLRGP